MPSVAAPKPVPEHRATGQTAQIYHEIRQSLRVSGVNLNFRSWAGFRHFFPAMWRASRPVVETLAFERAADQLRADAVAAAARMGAPGVEALTPLGGSQQYQIRAALLLYHYINPKLLVLTSGVKQALESPPAPPAEQATAPVPLTQRGVPEGMYPMEMVEENPKAPELRRIFRDIKKTLSLKSINSDYRTLALWPEYLEPAWRQLKACAGRTEYQASGDELRHRARGLAMELPRRIVLSPAELEAHGEDLQAVRETTERFERLLPGLILNIALLALDLVPEEHLAFSPFPAEPAEG